MALTGTFGGHYDGPFDVLDEGEGLVLSFVDEVTVLEYEDSQLSGRDFDFERMEQRAVALSEQLHSFIDDLRRLARAA